MVNFDDKREPQNSILSFRAAVPNLGHRWTGTQNLPQQSNNRYISTCFSCVKLFSIGNADSLIRLQNIWALQPHKNMDVN